jgi:tetratricopeptide (TPR) repeat protein
LAYFDLAAKTRAVPDLREAYQILSRLPPQRQDPVVETDLGFLLLAQSETDPAIRMFPRASASSNAWYVYCPGQALERAGKVEEATKELKRSIEATRDCG